METDPLSARDGSEDRHTAELYHLKTDPDELHNLAEDVDHQRVRQRLQNLLSDMLTAEGLTQETDKMPLDEGIKTELPDQKIR
jgi:N-acetylglucosamine-6-sulfatase